MKGPVALVLIAATTVSCAAELSDIRPEAIRPRNPSADRQTQGRNLLAEMFEAHGGIDRWRQFNFVTAKVSDEWFNSLFWTLAAPYTENPEYVAVAAYTRTFPHGRIEFTGGRNAGETWVADGDVNHRKALGESPEVVATADDGLFASFVHNFLVWPNFPFILASADRVAHVGSEQWRGQRYEKVFISWGDFGPQADVDQWILWINAESNMLERVWFTIRLAGKDAVGGYNFKEFEEVQGLKVATVCEGVLGLDDDPLHTYVLSEIEFSNRQRADLMSVAP